MKREMVVILCVTLLVSITLPSVSQAQLPDKANKFSIGGNVNRFQDDFGVGLVMTSPFFNNGKMALQASVIMNYHEGIPLGETTFGWMPYTTIKFGTIGVAGVIANTIRLYGGGGLVVIMPNEDFSDETVIGGYGVFGFEFFMGENAPVSYYMELGGIGTGARAELLPGEPIYANGFSATVGVKWHM